MKRRHIRLLFVLIQLILYISFLALDMFNGNVKLSNYIKFTVVVLCFLYVLSNGREKADGQLLFLRFAMFFTLISDTLILLLDYYFYGVLTFIIAQQFHGIRITVLKDKDKNLIKDFAIRILYQAAISLTIVFLLWKVNILINGLLAASVFYFTCIFINTVRSIRSAVLCRDKKNVYSAVGMMLFLLCDVNVGLFNLSDFLSVGPVYNIIYSLSSILMWAFYAPSQVIISLSKDTL